MNANVTISATLITPGNRFVLGWYAASAPSTLIGSVSPNPPYPGPFQVTITGLTAQLYILVLYENSSSTPGGTTRNSCNFQPSQSSVTVRNDLYLTADISAGFASGTTTYVDATLEGWTFDLELYGSGTLQNGTDYTYNGSTGTITFVSIGISPGMKVILHFQAQVASAPQAPPSLISSGVTLTGNTTLDNTYVNKAIYVQGSGSSLTLTLPALSTISDYQQLIFYSNGGSHINAIFNTAGSDNILWKTNITQMVLGQYEMLKLFKANGLWNVDFVSDGVNKVGEIVDSYLVNGPNILMLDGTTKSRAAYARLWTWVLSLPSLCRVSDANWSNTSTLNGQTYSINKGLFSTGDGSTTFRLPDLRLYGYRRNCAGSGTDVGGSFINGLVGQFTDNVILNLGDSFTGPPSGGWSGNPGRGQNSPTAEDYAQTFNAGVQNRPNTTGVVAGIRI